MTWICNMPECRAVLPSLAEVIVDGAKWVAMEGRIRELESRCIAMSYLIPGETLIGDLRGKAEAVRKILDSQNDANAAPQRGTGSATNHTTECLFQHFLSYSSLTRTPDLRRAFYAGRSEAMPVSVDDRCAVCEAASKTPDPSRRTGPYTGDYDDLPGDRSICDATPLKTGKEQS